MLPELASTTALDPARISEAIPVGPDDLADRLLRRTIYLIALFPSAYFWWMLFDFLFFHSSYEARGVTE